MQMKGKLNRTGSIVFCILILAVLLMIYLGKYDLYMYQDETMSYTGANNPDGFDYDLKDRTWYEGEDFIRPLTAQTGHLFDYKMVWKNQESDTHPPFYHVLLHTLCSFFPEHFSKWFGMSINIIAMIIVAILTYQTGFLLYRGNRVLTICGMIAYIVSISTITQVMFLRMYVVLQIFTSAIIYLHLLSIQQELSKRKFYICLYAITVLGTLTQYFYLIFAFFLSVGYCIYLLMKKAWKEVIGYLFTMLIAAATVFLTFPAIIMHLFHKEVGEIAVGNAMNLSDIRLRIATMFGIVSEQVFGNQCKLFIFIVCLFCCAYIVRMYRKRQLKNIVSELGKGSGNAFCVSWILCIVTALCYFIVVSLITPYLCDRYLSPIFMIVILMAVGVAFYILRDILKPENLPYYLVIVLAMVPMIVMINGSLEDTAKMEMLYKADEYSMTPCIVFGQDIATENFMELSKYERLYCIYDAEPFLPITDRTLQDATEIVVYIPNDQDVDICVQRLYDCNLGLSTYERLYVAYYSTVYLVH